MNIDKNIYNKLSDDQKKRLENAKTPQEIIDLAKETGYTLSEEQLDAISSGVCWDCPMNCFPQECIPFSDN